MANRENSEQGYQPSTTETESTHTNLHEEARDEQTLPEETKTPPASPEAAEPASSPEAEGAIIPDVVFKDPEINTETMQYVFKSPGTPGAGGRKIIVLTSESPKPVPGRRYRVRIIDDTNPTNPHKGKLLGVIIPDDEVVLTKAWEEAEEYVNEAELQKRMAGRSMHTVRQRTGVTSAEARSVPDEYLFNHLPKERRGSLKHRMARIDYARHEAETLLGELNSQERALVTMRWRNLVEAVRAEDKIKERRQALVREEAEIRRGISDVTPPDFEDIAALRRIEEKTSELVEQLYHLYNESSPEAFYGLHLRELKEYKDALAAPGENKTSRRIVETPYVHEQAEEILTYLQANKPVFIYGHLGSGKTELAIHVAREYIGREPLIISGSKHTSLSDLYGHQVLRLDTVNDQERDQFIEEVWQKFEKWKTEHPDADEGEKDRMHKTIFETYLTKFQNGTVSGWWLGPVYEAMAEGRPIIVDEVNAIPHEVLISLNHALTRRVGETMQAHQAGGQSISVKEGYGVIMTGNLNQGDERYVQREDLDPAFRSRVHMMEHDYLPQATEGARRAEAGEGNELYHVLLAKLMDRNGNIAGPIDIFDTTWRLAKVSRLIQNIFAGRQVDERMYYQVPGKRGVSVPLTENVLSLRHLDTIIGQWQSEGFARELDFYLWRDFVSQIHNPVERAYLYQILQEQFDFFKSSGWPSGLKAGDSDEQKKRRIDYDAIVQGAAFRVTPPKNSASEEIFFGPRQVVEAAFGEGPDRTAWPHAVEKK